MCMRILVIENLGISALPRFEGISKFLIISPGRAEFPRAQLWIFNRIFNQGSE